MKLIVTKLPVKLIINASGLLRSIYAPYVTLWHPFQPAFSIAATTVRAFREDAYMCEFNDYKDRNW